MNPGNIVRSWTANLIKEASGVPVLIIVGSKVLDGAGWLANVAHAVDLDEAPPSRAPAPQLPRKVIAVIQQIIYDTRTFNKVEKIFEHRADAEAYLAELRSKPHPLWEGTDSVGFYTETYELVHSPAGAPLEEDPYQRCLLCGDPRGLHTKRAADWRAVPGCIGHYREPAAGAPPPEKP
jgi:hypothetical protein